MLHFSEDPSIELFVPHVAATAQQPDAYVWAVDPERAPDYWFPRDCPRAMAWVEPTTTTADRDRILGPGGGERVHAVEYRWLDARPVRPLAPPEPVGDLLGLHERAGIQLRVLPSLWEFWDAVVDSTLGFSGIRLRNAAPRP